MRRILRAGYFRPVTWLTCVATVLVPLLVPAPRAAAQNANLVPVAVVQVVNQSGSAVQNLAARMAAALNAQLAASGRYKVIGQSAVDAAVEAANVRLPLRPDVRDQQLLSLANGLQAAYLITATIDSIEIDVAKQLAVVRSRLNVFGRVAQGDVTIVETNAFNLTRSKTEASLLDDAVEQNALYAVKGMVTQLGIVGKVIVPPLEDTMRISIRESDHLRKGAQVVLLRNGLRYAIAVVNTTSAIEAEVRIIERIRPEITPSVNDEVVFYRQGTGDLTAHNSDTDVNKDVPRANERERTSWSTILAIAGGVLLLGVGAWALTNSRKSRNDSRTPILVSPTNNSTLALNATGQFDNPPVFVATAVRDAGNIVLQVSSNTAFTTLAYTATLASTGTSGTTSAVTNISFQVPTNFVGAGTYYWRVLVVSGDQQYVSNVYTLNITGPGGSSGTTALRSPDTVTAAASSGSVLVQWTPVPNAAGYQVWRRVLTPRAANQGSTRTWRPTTGSDQWLRSSARRSPRLERANRHGSDSRQTTTSLAGFVKLADVPSTQLAYTDSAVQNGTEYQYVVVTLNSAGAVGALADAQATSFAATTPLNGTPPAVPTGLTAVAGDGQVVLNWSANNETDLAGYQVIRSTSPSSTFDLATNLVTDSQSPTGNPPLSANYNRITLTDGGRTNGTTVYYRIRSVQIVPANNTTKGGAVSAWSAAVQATPSSAPPQELQVIQPPNGSTIDADRPQLAWRGVTGASEYTFEISPDANFAAGTVISKKVASTDIIYPSDLAALSANTKYYMRVGIFDTSIQAMRYGPTSSFTRGAVQRYTTTVTASYPGLTDYPGARVTMDDADTGLITPAQFILVPKPGNAAYKFEATAYMTDGTKLYGTVNYVPGANANGLLNIPMAAIGIAPAAPTGLMVTGQADRIVLRWNPNTTGAAVQSYVVTRRSNTVEGPYAQIATVPAGTAAGQLIYTDYNVTAGIRYYYQIVARTTVGAATVDSPPSVAANGVAGVGAIQVIAPQDNQSFDSVWTTGSWTNTIQFAWVAVTNAARYIFEIGTDPELHDLLANGNKVIAASSQPTTSVTLGVAAGTKQQFQPPILTDTLYWRVIAVDENNLIINQTEARRIFQTHPTLAAAP